MNKTKVYKTYAVETKAVDEDQGIYEAMVSTEAVDRDEDVLLASGADIANFLKNPVVLWGHNYWDPEAVVAIALDVVKIPGRGVKLVFQFIQRGISKTADLVHDLWAAGYLRAMSVGFIPKAFERRKDSEGEELVRGYLFTLWELLEGSIVTIPANQDALRLAYDAMREKGYSEQELKQVLIESNIYEEMRKAIQDELERMKELRQSLEKMISSGQVSDLSEADCQAEAIEPTTPEPDNNEPLPEAGAAHDASDEAELEKIAKALQVYFQIISNQFKR